MKTFLTLFIILLVPAVVLGQGVLRGVVSDSTSHEKLVGVNVVIVGTGLGGATNVNGEYRISGIPGTNVKVRVSSIGYEPKVTDLDFSKRTSLQWDVELVSTVIIGKEFVVTAQRKGQIAAINQQLTAPTITNVVSEEKIQAWALRMSNQVI